MFWMNGMGPRGPMYGHRGYRRMNRRPRGWGILLLLPVLMFSGWMILAVIGGIFGAVIMLLGSLLGGAVSIFEGLGSVGSGIFSGLTSVGSIAIGIIIGVALYFRLKKRNRNTEQKEEYTVDGEAVEAEIVEPQYHYMNK